MTNEEKMIAERNAINQARVLTKLGPF